MGLEWPILPVVAAIFLAALIRSAFGFGEALVAVPLHALVIKVEEAVPLATLVSITVAAIVVAQDWHKIHVSTAPCPCRELSTGLRQLRRCGRLGWRSPDG